MNNEEREYIQSVMNRLRDCVYGEKILVVSARAVRYEDAGPLFGKLRFVEFILAIDDCGMRLSGSFSPGESLQKQLANLDEQILGSMKTFEMLRKISRRIRSIEELRKGSTCLK